MKFDSTLTYEIRHIGYRASTNSIKQAINHWLTLIKKGSRDNIELLAGTRVLARYQSGTIQCYYILKHNDWQQWIKHKLIERGITVSLSG